MSAPRGAGASPPDEPVDAGALPPSAFPETLAGLRAALAHAELDAVSFARPLARCDILDCLGQCCTEGTALSDEEVAVLRAVVREEHAFFAAHGIADAEAQLQSSGRAGAGGRTLVRERGDDEVAGDFPRRFGRAACAFLLDGGRCAFQVLSVERGRDPWWWKPVRCRLHPVSLLGGVIALPDDARGRWSGPEGGGASAVTRCGRTMPNGVPARALLADELAWLGAVLGRDLRTELAAADSEAYLPVPNHGASRSSGSAPSAPPEGG